MEEIQPAGAGVAEPDALRPLIEEATRGEYEILGELGRGGMAAVYLATDVSLNRKVAIKTMLPELIAKSQMVQRFKREAQMAAGLSHPHIIQIHSVRETKRLVYFVMKFIEGRSLDSIIAERGALDLDMARLILQQSGSALSFAHHRGVIHRDVKPANIMIDENGWAVVTDFGIAKLEDAQGLTGTGNTVGTPQYMSPEQFHAKPITGATDQYALGIVAYEMLAGRKPFDGGTFGEIVTKQLFAPPPDIREARADLPESVSATIQRMLAKDAADRFPDLDAAIAAFGHPAPDRLDLVRAQLVASARSRPSATPRLSVPMSPVPTTRPSQQATSMLEALPAERRSEPRTPRAAPTVLETKHRPSRAFTVSAVTALVFILAAGAFAWTRVSSGEATARRAMDRGVTRWREGQPAAAREEFRRAAAATPTAALPHVYLARLAREQGDLASARDQAATAVRLEPANGVALREFAGVAFASGNYDAARRFYVRALRVNTGDRAAMGWLGCTFRKLGDEGQASRWLSRAGAGPWAACTP